MGCASCCSHDVEDDACVERAGGRLALGTAAAPACQKIRRVCLEMNAEDSPRARRYVSRGGARGAAGIEGQGDKMGVGEFLSGKSVPAIIHEEHYNLREHET